MNKTKPENNGSKRFSLSAWRHPFDHLATGKILSNVGWLSSEHLLRTAFGLVVGIWMARYLGPHLYGIYCYAVAFVALFSPFVGLGLNRVVVRELVNHKPERDQNMGTAFAMKILGSLSGLTLLFLTITVLRPPEENLTRCIVLLIGGGLFFQSFDIVDLWFQAQVQSKYPVLAKNAAYLLACVAKVGLILFGASLIAFAYVNLIEAAMGAMGLLIAYQRSGQSLQKWKISLNRAKCLLRDGWPLMFSGLTVMIYMRIDQVMLGEMLGEREVGIYGIAVGLSEFWYFIPLSITSSVFPSMLRAKAESDAVFYNQFQKLYNLMALLAYLVAIPTTFLACWIVTFLFGKAFSPAGPILAVLIWGNLFTYLGLARGVYLTAMNWTRLYLLSTSIGCCINVILNFILIPKYGGMGTAIASVAAYWMATHGSCFLSKPLYRTGRMLFQSMFFPNPWRR